MYLNNDGQICYKRNLKFCGCSEEGQIAAGLSRLPEKAVCPEATVVVPLCSIVEPSGSPIQGPCLSFFFFPRGDQPDLHLLLFRADIILFIL